MSSSDSGNSGLEDILNVATQFFTFGAAGFERGGITPGITGEPVVEGAKEITGATAAEEATALARERFEEEKGIAIEQRKEGKRQTARQQLIASNLAAGSRKGGNQTPGKTTSLGAEVDFLGI